MSLHTDTLLAEAKRMVEAAEASTPLPGNVSHKNSLWVSPITSADAYLWSAYWTAFLGRQAKSRELVSNARKQYDQGRSTSSFFSTFTRDDSTANIQRILRTTWGQVNAVATPPKSIAKVWSMGEEGVERVKGYEREARPISSRIDSSANLAAQVAQETQKKAQTGLLVIAAVGALGAFILYRVMFPPPLRVNRGPRSRRR